MNLSKLLANRITIILEDAIVVGFVSRSLGLEKRIRAAGAIEPRNRVGIAFAAKPTASRYARILSEGILKLRRTGELKTILDRYRVEDWKK
jgi:polar amino acid transport system substrate-binding protein